MIFPVVVVVDVYLDYDQEDGTPMKHRGPRDHPIMHDTKSLIMGSNFITVKGSFGSRVGSGSLVFSLNKDSSVMSVPIQILKDEQVDISLEQLDLEPYEWMFTMYDEEPTKALPADFFGGRNNLKVEGFDPNSCPNLKAVAFLFCDQTYGQQYGVRQVILCIMEMARPKMMVFTGIKFVSSRWHLDNRTTDDLFPCQRSFDAQYVFVERI